MTKWMAVAALGVALMACGCKHHNDEPTTMSAKPMKMSAGSGAACPVGECAKTADKK